MTTTCWSCGTKYDGWSCPTCATRKAAEKAREAAEETRKTVEKTHEEALEEQERMFQKQRDAAEKDLEEQREALEDATEKQKQNISEAWKLQAMAKAERAAELMGAGMFAEAMALFQGAISQDPGNLGAYVGIVWSLVKLQRIDEAREYIDKAIRLLGINRPAKSREWYQAIAGLLSAVGKPPEAVALFTSVLRNNASSLVDTGDSLSDQIDLMNTLMHNDFSEGVVFLCETALNHTPAPLQICALYLESHSRIGTAANDNLIAKIIAAYPYTKRKEILSQFDWVLKSRLISEKNKHTIRELLMSRYKEWIPMIKEELEGIVWREADQRAKHAIRPSRAGVVAGVVGGIFLSGSGAPGSATFLLSIVIGVAVFAATKQVQKSRQAKIQSQSQLRVSLETTEQLMWKRVGLEFDLSEKIPDTIWPPTS